MTNVDFLPVVVQRRCGGWLARSERRDEIRIGVTAESEEAVRAKFAATIAKWRELLTEEARRPGV